jgi:hypothetical protein
MRLLTQPLHPHPASAAPAGVKALHVRAHVASHGLTLSFVLQAEPGALRLPPRERPQATDGLWQHTCFEAFVGTDADRSYQEFNFAPSHRWAAYRFSDYRVRAPDAMLSAHDPVPRIATRTGRSGSGAFFVLRAQIPGSALPPAASLDALQLGLSAVLEASDGSLSWWALRHPCERPDFHHRGGFLRLSELSLQNP